MAVHDRPLDRCVHHVEPVILWPDREDFLDQEVGRREGEMDAGRGGDWAAAVMRLDVDAMRRGQRGDLPHAGEAAGDAHVRLRKREGAGLEVAAEIAERRKPLAAGDRDAGLHPDLARRGRVFRIRHFLHAEGARVGDPPPEADRIHRPHVAVQLDDDVHRRSHRITHGLDTGDSQVFVPALDVAGDVVIQRRSARIVIPLTTSARSG